MSDDDKDLFGKIDALFEKRSPDMLLDTGLEHEDFPLLTEVVAETKPVPLAWDEPERRVFDRRAAERRQPERRATERRLGDRREQNQDSEPPPRPTAPSEELERLVQSMELRLSDLFIRQQLRMEEAVRKVVREEMARAASKSRGHSKADSGDKADENADDRKRDR